METSGQPVVEALPGMGQVDVTDASLLEAEFAAPGEDLRLECDDIGIVKLSARSGQCKFLIN